MAKKSVARREQQRALRRPRDLAKIKRYWGIDDLNKAFPQGAKWDLHKRVPDDLICHLAKLAKYCPDMSMASCLLSWRKGKRLKQYIKLPIDDVRRSYSILASDAAEAWKGSLDLAASVTAAQAEDEKESGSGSQNAGKVVKDGTANDEELKDQDRSDDDDEDDEEEEEEDPGEAKRIGMEEAARGVQASLQRSLIAGAESAFQVSGPPDPVTLRDEVSDRLEDVHDGISDIQSRSQGMMNSFRDESEYRHSGLSNLIEKGLEIYQLFVDADAVALKAEIRDVVEDLHRFDRAVLRKVISIFERRGVILLGVVQLYGEANVIAAQAGDESEVEGAEQVNGGADGGETEEADRRVKDADEDGDQVGGVKL